jgi:hypothetical protein
VEHIAGGLASVIVTGAGAPGFCIWLVRALRWWAAKQPTLRLLGGSAGLAQGVRRHPGGWA